MVDRSGKTLSDLVRHLGRYPEEAFLFVRDGLNHAANHVHGTESETHQVVQRFIIQNELEWDEFCLRFGRRELPDTLIRLVEAAGGCEKLSRHVSGRQLCWGLRDYALHRWGMLARQVLESWNIRETRDFGRIVFGFIDFNMMQKQESDRIEDFEDVFRFDQAFADPPTRDQRN